MRDNNRFIKIALSVVLGGGTALAGDETMTSSATGTGKQVSYAETSGLGSTATYEAGRGLITLEGPSGMFMNPTSATLPQGASTLQYCMFLPQRDSSVIGHGIFGAYGVTDSLEIGVIGNHVEIDGGGSLDAYGPFARYRILKNEGLVPQLSVGGYGKFGDDALTTYGAFAAGYWRIPIDEDGLVQSLGVHAGVRGNWYDVGPGNSVHAYGGLELQLPYRLYLIGEVSSRDNDVDAVEAPYAFGAQWRLFGINLTVAGIQNGSLDNSPALYWGIGGGFQF